MQSRTEQGVAEPKYQGEPPMLQFLGVARPKYHL